MLCQWFELGVDEVLAENPGVQSEFFSESLSGVDADLAIPKRDRDDHRPLGIEGQAPARSLATPDAVEAVDIVRSGTLAVAKGFYDGNVIALGRRFFQPFDLIGEPIETIGNTGDVDSLTRKGGIRRPLRGSGLIRRERDCRDDR